MASDSMKDPDLRQRAAAKTIEYPPCFRVDRTKGVGPGQVEQRSPSRNDSALDYPPCLRAIPRYSHHGRQLNSASSCDIDPKGLVDAAPSFTSSQRSDWTPTSESTRESMLLMRRLEPFATKSSKPVEGPDPFVSLCLRHDSAAKLLELEKPGFSSINQHDQIVTPIYPVSIAFCEANDKGEDMFVAQNKHMVEEIKTDVQLNDPIDGSDNVSMNFPYGDFQLEETSWMTEFFEDSQPGEEDTLWNEVPRFKVETADDQEEKRQLKQKSHIYSRDKAKGLEADDTGGTNPDNRDSYFMKMLKKFLSSNTDDAAENSITLLPKCLRTTSCFSADPTATEPTTAVRTNENLMKMVDNIACMTLDGKRNSYQIVDAYVFERIHSMRSSSSTSFSSSTSSSLSTYTHESLLEKYSEDYRMDRHQCDVSHEGNKKPSTDLTDNCNGSNDTIPDRMLQFRNMGTNTDNRDDTLRIEYTPHDDTCRENGINMGINADQHPSVQLPKGKKWHRKLVQARQMLLLSRQQHKSQFLYLQSESSSSSSSC